MPRLFFLSAVLLVVAAARWQYAQGQNLHSDHRTQNMPPGKVQEDKNKAQEDKVKVQEDKNKVQEDKNKDHHGQGKSTGHGKRGPGLHRADGSYRVARRIVDPIRIVNPPENQVGLNYMLNGSHYSIPPGHVQKLNDDRQWIIEFSRGSSFGIGRYRLGRGLYQFGGTDHGWELYRMNAPAPPPPVAVSPTNPLPGKGYQPPVLPQPTNPEPIAPGTSGSDASATDSSDADSSDYDSSDADSSGTDSSASGPSSSDSKPRSGSTTPPSSSKPPGAGPF